MKTFMYLMLKRDKQITLVWIFFLTTLLCFGQRDHYLETAKDYNLYESFLKEHIDDYKGYYDNVFSLLYSGFSQKPYARYACLPSFEAEYAFSVEEIEGKSYIISNGLSEDYSETGFKSRGIFVRIITSKVEINSDLYLKIGELFEILAEQTKTTGQYILGIDGETYYFSTTDKNGEIIIGETWSPSYNSTLGRLVQICNTLFSMGMGRNISQTEILMKEIDKLINDLRKQ